MKRISVELVPRDEDALRGELALLGKFKERGIASIVHTSVADLAGIHGIGPSKAASILAAVELGRRLAKKAAEQVQLSHPPGWAGGGGQETVHGQFLLLEACAPIIAHLRWKSKGRDGTG